MTSRRDFLGLLAIAPAAVPVALQAAAAPRYVGGMVGEAYFSSLVGEDCHGGFVLSPSQSIAFRKVMNAPMTRAEPVTILMRHSSPQETPNRLHGTYINDEGDAV